MTRRDAVKTSAAMLRRGTAHARSPCAVQLPSCPGRRLWSAAACRRAAAERAGWRRRGEIRSADREGGDQPYRLVLRRIGWAMLTEYVHRREGFGSLALRPQDGGAVRRDQQMGKSSHMRRRLLVDAVRVHAGDVCRVSGLQRSPALHTPRCLDERDLGIAVVGSILIGRVSGSPISPPSCDHRRRRLHDEIVSGASARPMLKCQEKTPRERSLIISAISSGVLLSCRCAGYHPAPPAGRPRGGRHEDGDRRTLLARKSSTTIGSGCARRGNGHRGPLCGFPDRRPQRTALSHAVGPRRGPGRHRD